MTEEKKFTQWLSASKYYQVIRGLSLNEQQIAWDAWQARASLPDEALTDFLRLAQFSDGWNSYNFEEFKEFRKREIARAAKKPE